MTRRSNHELNVKICMIIPCYNEDNRLDPKKFIDFLKADQTVDFYFINDGSTDATQAIINRVSEAAPHRVHSVERVVNKGKAFSIREGMLDILDDNRYSFIGYLDADLSAPLNSIQQLLRPFHDKPSLLMTFGSRFARLGSNIQRNVWRHYFGRVFATVASIMLGVTVYDTQCGAKLFKREFARIIFKDSFVTTWIFDLELLARAKSYQNDTPLDEVADEVALKEWVDVPGSKIKLTYIFKIGYEFFLFYRRYNKKKTHNQQI